MSSETRLFLSSASWHWLRVALVAVVGLGGIMAGVLLGAAAFALLSVRAPAVPADPRGFQEMIERRPVHPGQADATGPVVAGRLAGIGGPSPDSGSPASYSPSSSSDPADASVLSGPIFLDRTAEAADAVPDGRFNILILGVDRVEGLAGNTDVIMLLSVDFDRQTAALISFPRDLCVGDCARWTDRLNSVYPRYGAGAMLEVVSELTGQIVEHYVVVNFDSFATIIDRVGGVSVFADRDFNDLVPHPVGSSSLLRMSSGVNQLDGREALMFARSRKYDPTGDFARICRQQQIVVSLFDALSRPQTLLALPSLLVELGHAVETDIPIGRIIELGRLAASGAINSVQQAVIQKASLPRAVVRGVDGSYLISSTEQEIRATIAAAASPVPGGSPAASCATG
jgi:LCP family protein required for cell wall assembly